MTRINVGIDPKTLCDQHLIAEYRELPRLWNFKSKTKPPPFFKLGSGHVIWCAQYQGMLVDRFKSIVDEMFYRGFKVSFPNPPDNILNNLRPNENEIKYAGVIVQERLNSKLKTTE